MTPARSETICFYEFKTKKLHHISLIAEAIISFINDKKV
jgi:hypothetical protein